MMREHTLTSSHCWSQSETVWQCWRSKRARVLTSLSYADLLFLTLMCMVRIWHRKRAHETLRRSRSKCATPRRFATPTQPQSKLRHEHRDCDSARQRLARPAQDTSRAALHLGSRTPAVERKAHRSLSAQITYTMRTPYIRIGSQTAPRPSISIIIPIYCISRSSLLSDSHPISYFPFSFPYPSPCTNSAIRTFPLPAWFPPTPCARARAPHLFTERFLCIKYIATCSRQKRSPPGQKITFPPLSSCVCVSPCAPSRLRLRVPDCVSAFSIASLPDCVLLVSIASL